MSKKQPIVDFIYEGGLGFNSLKEGSLAGKIFSFKGTAFGKEFEYGLGYHPLYNVGYPLHRMTTKSGNNLSKGVFRGVVDSITELTLSIQQKKEFEIEYFEKDISQISFVSQATNVMFVNEFGANLMGFEKAGTVVTYSRDVQQNKEVMMTTPKNKIWENRFIEDKLPAEQSVLKVLTTISNVKKIHQAFAEKMTGVFAVLLTNIGPLLVMSVEKALFKVTVDELSTYPMTYLITSRE